MVKEITLRQAGGSVAVTLPRDMMDRLHMQPGDKMFAVETENGVLLTPYAPDLDAAMQAFQDVRKQYRNTLRKLAE